MDHGKDKPKVKLVGMGLPSTVHRFLQTERCTSRPRRTCTPSASDDERLRVFSRQKFSLASLRLDVSWPPDFWWWDDSTLILGFLPIGLAYHALFDRIALLGWLAISKAWPSELENFADEGEETESSEN